MTAPRTQRNAWTRVCFTSMALGWSSNGFADIEQCVEAHSQGQFMRDEGMLLQAQAELLSCASDEACPGPIKEECEQYLKDVQRLTPSMVFAARDHVGRDIDGVRIYKDDERVKWTSGAAPFSVDPGPHVFRFEHPSGQVIEQKVEAVQGEKARLVVAEFSDHTVLTQPAPPHTTAVESPPSDLRKVMTYTFGGLALVGLASFAVLGLQGASEEADLRETCAPNCTGRQKQSVAQKYLWADVSLAVAGLSIAGGAVLYFAPLGADDTTASVSFQGEF